MTAAVLGTGLASFAMNLPLGRWRSRCRRGSVQWFAALHASIPAIVLLRFHFGIPLKWAPLFAVLAVLGQLIGGRRATSRA